VKCTKRVSILKNGRLKVEIYPGFLTGEIHVRKGEWKGPGNYAHPLTADEGYGKIKEITAMTRALISRMGTTEGSWSKGGPCHKLAIDGERRIRPTTPGFVGRTYIIKNLKPHSVKKGRKLAVPDTPPFKVKTPMVTTGIPPQVPRLKKQNNKFKKLQVGTKIIEPPENYRGKKWKKNQENLESGEVLHIPGGLRKCPMPGYQKVS